MKIVLKTLLRTHTYEFAGQIRRQKEGGAIGMELTGVVAQIFMVWWDKELQERLRKINFQLKLYERYLDDTNTVAGKTQLGARYDGERIIITDTLIAEDHGIPDDRRTMILLQSVAAHIQGLSKKKKTLEKMTEKSHYLSTDAVLRITYLICNYLTSLPILNNLEQYNGFYGLSNLREHFRQLPRD